MGLFINGYKEDEMLAINKNKYFDTLEECYKYTNPMYGEIYLTNGYLERRKYYGTKE